jgi:hypothetical protein
MSAKSSPAGPDRKARAATKDDDVRHGPAQPLIKAKLCILLGLGTIAAAGCLILVPTSSPATAAAVNARSITYYQIKNFHTIKCLDVEGGSQAVGARVQQFSCNGSVAQQWTKVFTDSGYFQLRLAASGQCLEVEGASQDNNHRVVQNPCTGGFHQQWIQRTSGVSGWPFLVARHSGKGLAFFGASALNGVLAVQRELEIDTVSLHDMDWQFQ